MTEGRAKGVGTLPKDSAGDSVDSIKRRMRRQRQYAPTETIQVWQTPFKRLLRTVNRRVVISVALYSFADPHGPRTTSDGWLAKTKGPDDKDTVHVNGEGGA